MACNRCTSLEGALLPDKSVNNLGTIQVPVVVPLPQTDSTQALRQRVRYIQILKVLIF